MESGRTEHRAAAPKRVTERVLVPDDEPTIREAFVRLLAGDALVVIASGGTGIAGRDVTVLVVTSLLQKPLPGFGELFRMLSYREVGGAAMLSRAVGGLAAGGLVFALPGSLNAVRTAWEGCYKRSCRTSSTKCSGKVKGVTVTDQADLTLRRAPRPL